MGIRLFLYKRKRKRIRRVPFTTGSAFSSFACQKTTPAFAIDIIIPKHFYFGVQRHAASATLPRDRLLEPRFSLFLRSAKSRIALGRAAKIHSFRPHSLHKFRSLGKCARRILEVTLGKSAILPALYYTLIRVLHYTLIAPQAAATAVSSCISRAPSVSAQVLHIAVTYDRGAASRCFEGTFHVFANVLAKTFHFCAVGTSYMFVYYYNYAGQTSIRVRRRVMDLRAGLDGGDAGNTCCIIKSLPFKDVRKDTFSCVPA